MPDTCVDRILCNPPFGKQLSDPTAIRLNLTATRDNPTLTAVIRITGTAAKPVVTLTSTPALPVPNEDREKHAFRVRDRTRRISYSHHLRHEGDMGRNLR